MSLQRGGQIMGAASTLAARFMAQPDQLREAMARNMGSVPAGGGMTL
ncbi:hypothetical protein [Rhizobium tibeticum]|nr:hypothetical protein [Rhizobium tibeticum]